MVFVRPLRPATAVQGGMIGMQHVDFAALEFVQMSRLAFICEVNNRVDSKRPHALSQQANCGILTPSCPGGDTDTHRGQAQRFLFS